MTDGNDAAYACNETRGLTKRELFAAMAMQGLLADHTIHATNERFAEDAVAFADALIAELNKEEGV